jgi:hypothetical protein
MVDRVKAGMPVPGMRQRGLVVDIGALLGSFMKYMPIKSYYILKQYMSRAILFEHEQGRYI